MPMHSRQRFHRTLTLLAAGVFGLLPQPATPSQESVGVPSEVVGKRLPAPGSEPWQPLIFPKIARHTRYERVQRGDAASGDIGRGSSSETALRARSDCAASGLLLPFPAGIDLAQTPRLRWRWRVERSLDVTDEREKSGDDFAARVYALFDFDAEQSTVWERVRRRIGVALYGEGLPGKAISYVWASSQPAGSHWPNPYSADTQMLALRSGPEEGWQTETVDLLADHRRLLGGAPTPITAIALMSDSDDSCQQAVAYYADFELLPPAE